MKIIKKPLLIMRASVSKGYVFCDLHSDSLLTIYRIGVGLSIYNKEIFRLTFHRVRRRVMEAIYDESY